MNHVKIALAKLKLSHSTLNTAIVWLIVLRLMALLHFQLMVIWNVSVNLNSNGLITSKYVEQTVQTYLMPIKKQICQNCRYHNANVLKTFSLGPGWELLMEYQANVPYLVKAGTHSSQIKMSLTASAQMGKYGINILLTAFILVNKRNHCLDGRLLWLLSLAWFLLPSLVSLYIDL